jgi:hypothetical protein
MDFAIQMERVEIRMLGFRLQLKQHPDGRLIFTIPLGYKLLLLIIGVLILVSLIATREEGSGSIFVRQNIVPLIICILSLLGAAYHESWIFDKKAGQVVHQNGLIGLHSNKVIRIEDLEYVEISRFYRGRLGSSPGSSPGITPGSSPGTGTSQQTRRSLAFRPVITLSLHTKDHGIFRLENYRGSHLKKVESTARSIADYCGIVFRKDTPDSGEV